MRQTRAGKLVGKRTGTQGCGWCAGLGLRRTQRRPNVCDRAQGVQGNMSVSSVSSPLTKSLQERELKRCVSTPGVLDSGKDQRPSLGRDNDVKKVDG